MCDWLHQRGSASVEKEGGADIGLPGIRGCQSLVTGDLLADLIL